MIILGDGRSNYAKPRLDLMREIAERARAVIWLNPEPETYWGQGDSEWSVRRFCNVAKTCNTPGRARADHRGRAADLYAEIVEERRPVGVASQAGHRDASKPGGDLVRRFAQARPWPVLVHHYRRQLEARSADHGRGG